MSHQGVRIMVQPMVRIMVRIGGRCAPPRSARASPRPRAGGARAPHGPGLAFARGRPSLGADTRIGQDHRHEDGAVLVCVFLRPPAFLQFRQLPPCHWTGSVARGMFTPSCCTAHGSLHPCAVQSRRYVPPVMEPSAAVSGTKHGSKRPRDNYFRMQTILAGRRPSYSKGRELCSKPHYFFKFSTAHLFCENSE